VYTSIKSEHIGHINIVFCFIFIYVSVFPSGEGEL
jgi:hypothetical protein